MEIFFKSPSDTVGCIVVAEECGRYLSSTLKQNRFETAFFRKRREKFSKKEVSFCQTLKTFDDTEQTTLLYVASLVHVDMSEIEAQELGAKIFAVVSATKEKSILVDFSAEIDPLLVAHIAAGFKIRSFKFDKYKTKHNENNEHDDTITTAYFVSPNNAITEKAFEELDAVVEAVNVVRELSSEAPNILYPETVVKVAKELKNCDVKVDVLDEKDMKKLGMNALLSVGQGSDKESYVAICQWHGGKKEDAPIALVGKGVTFDSGGISIKPSNNMHEMKEDMTGAAIVLATMQMIAKLKLPLNVIGAVGLVENMPSGTASKPSDIVVSMSGQTIEIQNTDAEGRLVLADVLHYVVDQFKPQCIIDFATLTGAMQVALGQEFAGLFSNNTRLSELLLTAGQTVKERLWRLPLDPAFDKDIDSDIADMKNVGAGRGAGSITAAQFLQRFVQATPWAHIDIAAVTFDKKDRPLTGVGFTGFGVRLLNAFLNDVYRGHVVFRKDGGHD